MKRYLIKLALITIALVFGLQLLGLWLHQVFAQDEGDKIEWVKGVKDQRFDYAFLGNSRALAAVDIQKLNEETGSKGINLGYNGASLKLIYTMLYSFIEHQQNEVRIAVVQVDPVMLFEGRRHEHPLVDLYYHDLIRSPLLGESFERPNLVKAYAYAPILKYVEYHSLYSLKKFFRARSTANPFEQSFGTAYFPNRDTIQIPTRYEREIIPFTTVARDFDHLEKLVEFCRDRSIELVLYTAPVHRYDDLLGKEYPKFDSLRLVHMNANDNPWYDFRNLWPDNTAYFPDVVHLNKEGAAAFTTVLAREVPEIGSSSVQ